MRDFAVSETPSGLDAPLIVHSHLRWDFVWQRPQQLLSRLSERADVLFVEEPIYLDDVAIPRLEISEPIANVCRVVPMLPASMRTSYDQSATITCELLRREMAADGLFGNRYDRPVQWFYTPMAAPAMIGAFGELAVVYDCMDELSQFRFAPTELIDREKLLITEADVVFAGGVKLAQAKSQLHPNVHFFGCGVDSAHFASAMDDTVAVPPDLREIAGPVIGYYGVIDERLDYALLRELAGALPDVSLVMIGPVVKVAPSELPQASNIRWLGQRSYADLPAYVRRFDVCLMPFALNDATEFINPTKTLEYMAAGKVVVSTAISDVVRQFSAIVHVAASPSEFVEHVRSALERPDAQRIASGLDMARHHSWENIVRQMEDILRQSVRAHGEATANKRGGTGRVIRKANDAPTRSAATATREDSR
jgi:glycosyltransferase involved in cell wall biosynthesis